MKTPLKHIYRAVLALNHQLGIRANQGGILPRFRYEPDLLRTEPHLHELAHHLLLARRDGRFTYGLPKVARSATRQIDGLTELSKDLNELEAHALVIVIMREYGHRVRRDDLIRETGFSLSSRSRFKDLRELLYDNTILEIAARVKHHLDEEIARAESEAKRR